MSLKSRTQGSLTQTLTVTDCKEKRPTVKKNKTKTRLRRLAIAAVVLLTLYATPPLLLRYSRWMQSAIIFVHHVRIPFFSNLTNPPEFGLTNTRHFDLMQHDGCAVGTWHVLPDTYELNNVTETRHYDLALSDGSPIILYLHGNTGTRGTAHRVQLYQYLADRGYHVVSFDYRGYGDSECYPSERGMMEDSLLVWYWLQKRAGGNPVYIWGHSLGSAAATYLAQELWKLHHTPHPKGLILDAPMTSVLEAAAHHPFGAPYWPILPLFEYFIIGAFEEHFNSSARLKHIPYPIMIFHGHNDIIIPFHMGYRMWQEAVETRKLNPLLEEVHFVDCGEAAHKTNYKSSSFSSALEVFIDRNV